MESHAANTELPRACAFDGAGSAQLIALHGNREWIESPQPLWVQLDYSDTAHRKWLQEEAMLEEVAVDALLAEDTRPRTTQIGDGLLIALRGVNLNPGADPEDMVSIRLWIDARRIVSTKRRDMLSVKDITSQLKSGEGPCSTADFLVELVDRLTWRMSDTIENMEDQAAELEANMLEGAHGELRFELASLRRQAITLRRYLSPQRDALSKLATEKVSWIGDSERIEIREITDRLIRHMEDLEAVRERAAVSQEELLSRLSEQLNQRMYVLSIVAAIFLPLGFFTGLLGINVGGMPGADNPEAFWIFSGLLLVAVALQLLLFRWKKWL